MIKGKREERFIFLFFSFFFSLKLERRKWKIENMKMSQFFQNYSLLISTLNYRCCASAKES